MNNRFGDYSISLIILVVILCLAAVVCNLYWFLPASNNVAVETAITNTLAEASVYAIDNVSEKQNFLGYHSTTIASAPKCSGSLIVNISPDGSHLAIFGRSCSEPVYYCSALPVDDLAVNSFNINGSMAKIPASTVLEGRFDCKGMDLGTVSTSLSGSAPTPGAVIVIFNPNIKDIQMKKDLVKLDTLKCSKNWPNQPGAFLCTVMAGKESKLMTAAKSNPRIQSTSRWWGEI